MPDAIARACGLCLPWCVCHCMRIACRVRYGAGGVCHVSCVAVLFVGACMLQWDAGGSSEGTRLARHASRQPTGRHVRRHTYIHA